MHRYVFIAKPIALSLLMLIGGCDGLIPEKLSEQPQEYEVVSSSKGKRFTVDVRNTKTDEVIRQVSVNNTCRTTRRAKVGSKYTLTEATFKGRGGRIFHKVEGTAKLCHGSDWRIRGN